MSQEKRKEPPLRKSEVCGCVLATALVVASTGAMTILKIPGSVASETYNQVTSGIGNRWRDKNASYSSVITGIPVNVLEGVLGGILCGVGNGIRDSADIFNRALSGDTKTLTKLAIMDLLAAGAIFSGYMANRENGLSKDDPYVVSTVVNSAAAWLVNRSMSPDVATEEKKRA